MSSSTVSTLAPNQVRCNTRIQDGMVGSWCNFGRDISLSMLIHKIRLWDISRVQGLFQALSWGHARRFLQVRRQVQILVWGLVLSDSFESSVWFDQHTEQSLRTRDSLRACVDGDVVVPLEINETGTLESVYQLQAAVGLQFGVCASSMLSLVCAWRVSRSRAPKWSP